MCFLRLRRKLYNDKYGDSSADAYPKRLATHVDGLKNKGHLAAYDYTQDGQLYFAAISPMM